MSELAFILTASQADAIRSAYYVTDSAAIKRVRALYAVADANRTDGRMPSVRAILDAISAADDMPAFSAGTVSNAIVTGDIVREHLGGIVKAYPNVLAMMKHGRGAAEAAIAAIVRETGASMPETRADAVARLDRADAVSRARDAVAAIKALTDQRANMAIPAIESETADESGADAAPFNRPTLTPADEWDAVRLILANVKAHAADMPADVADAMSAILAARTPVLAAA